MTDPLEGWPADATANGHTPQIGRRVQVVSGVTGKTYTGYVDDNRAGLFLTLDDGRKVVLIAAEATVTPLPQLRAVDT